MLHVQSSRRPRIITRRVLSEICKYSVYNFSVANITEYQAQEALLDHVHDSCCYGTRAAKEMQILKVIPSCALQVGHFCRVISTGGHTQLMISFFVHEAK